MTLSEAMLWNAYIIKRGSLNVGRRVEIACANIAALTSRVHGGKANFLDFAIHEGDRLAQVDGFVKSFGAKKISREDWKESRKKRQK